MSQPTESSSRNSCVFDPKKIADAYDFAGKVVVLTGGTGILGSDMAVALADCGAQLAILDLNLEPGKALLQRMGPNASHAELFSCNVLQRESV
jgi:2-deoxy-D-gluconate 3-dehydrogenase